MIVSKTTLKTNKTSTACEPVSRTCNRSLLTLNSAVCIDLKPDKQKQSKTKKKNNQSIANKNKAKQNKIKAKANQSKAKQNDKTKPKQSKTKAKQIEP